MGERYQGIMNKILDYVPKTDQILSPAALVISGTIILLMTGFTAIVVVVLVPVLILLSPLLIPIGALLFVTVAGLFSVGFLGLVAFFGVSWLYNYVNGRKPLGSDQVDYACKRVVDTASHVKGYAWEYGGYLHGKLREAAPGA
ncbi:hypothetical protein SUGI_0694160 [Cryptomeria japonica]|uniref:oleosin n=1 Tax=Cryptomeria japonica TaxID=3369 RepID=UPI002414C70E|nr:oleosin [Cryptomeria japonica]GLJ34518.1 hypothetical protein SUGI_0694160 [Cryptomeria japonica]